MVRGGLGGIVNIVTALDVALTMTDWGQDDRRNYA